MRKYILYGIILLLILFFGTGIFIDLFGQEDIGVEPLYRLVHGALLTITMLICIIGTIIIILILLLLEELKKINNKK